MVPQGVRRVPAAARPTAFGRAPARSDAVGWTAFEGEDPLRTPAALLTVLVLLVLGGLAWLVLGSDAIDPTPDPATSASAPTAPDAPVERVGRPRAGRPLAAEPGTTAEPTAPEHDATPLDGRPVRIRNRNPAESADAVEAAYLPVAPGAEQRKLEDLGDDAVAHVLAHGRPVAVAADGTTRIGAVAHRAVVVARTPTREGLAWTRGKAQGELVVDLHPVLPVTVRVVDARGAPVGGCEVVLYDRSEWDDAIRARRRTAADTGETTFRIVRPPADEDRLVLTTAAPLRAQPEAVIDLARPPADVIELRLSATGTVVCEVVDEHGAPTGEGEFVALRRRPGPEFGHPEDDLVFRLDEHVHARAEVRGGRATFPRVGIGLDLEVRLAPEGAAHVTTCAQFSGPAEAGESARVRLRFGPPRPVLVGRVVTPQGEPVPDLLLYGQVLQRGERTQLFRHDFYARTRSDGRFRAVLDRMPADTAGHPVQLGRRVVMAGGGWTVREFGTAQIPDRIPASGGDLGDLVFHGAQVLVSGVVVDDVGRPLAGVQLAAMVHGANYRNPLKDTDVAKSDTDGRFEVGGAVDAEEITLGASLPGYYLAEAATFRRGSTDVRIALTRGGGLAGSIVRTAATRDLFVQIRVQGPPQDVFGVEHRSVRDGARLFPQEDGRFEIGTLRPGTARVELWLGWSADDSVFAVDDVLVTAGEVTRDPRLQEIDLAAFVRSHVVRVVGTDGHPLADALVHYRSMQGDAAWDRTQTDEDGVARIPSRADAVQIVAQADGHAAAQADDVSGNRTVRLARAERTVVTVRLRADSPLPDPPHEIEPSLDWVGPLGSDGVGDDGGDPRTVEDVSPFPKSREVAFAVWTPGRYRVTLLLWKTSISGARGTALPTVPLTRIVNVTGDGRPLTIEIGVDADLLARRLARDE